MEIRLLVCHRKENYTGEYLPEIVGFVDYATLEENPDWWPAEKEKIKQRTDDGTIAAWAEVTTDLDVDQLLSALYPKASVNNSGLERVGE